MLSRRALLCAPAGLLFASAKSHAMNPSPPEPGLANDEMLQADLDRYVSLGSKQSGGTGDNACGEWFEQTFAELSFATRRQEIDVPWFTKESAALKVGPTEIPLLPQMNVTPTAPGGVGARVVIVHASAGAGDVTDAIVLLILPFARWSSLMQMGLRSRVDGLFAAGAKAVVLVTTGPTGEAVLLNSPVSASFRGPVAIAAPKALKTIFEQTGPFEATLVLTGQSGTRRAFNLVAERQIGAAKTIVVSTPRSGWGVCAGERGPGVAIFLALAKWLAAKPAKFNLVFVCTSGHEFEGHGGDAFLGKLAPTPEQTHLWVHLGAGIAARDWHEAGGQLQPLKSADPQRYLVATPDRMAAATSCFAGLPGLEVPYSSEGGAEGELKQIFAAGYRSAIGAFGPHRFHHTALDDQRCVDSGLVKPVVAAFKEFIAQAIG